MTEFDLERMLARSQFCITVIFIAGYFGLVILTAMKLMDSSILKDVSPFVGIIVYYWFQRQRPHSATDGENGNGSVIPTKPVVPAPQQPLEKLK